MRALFDPPEPRRVSPGEYPVWDQALALLNRDLAVTLPQREPLQLLALPSYEADEPENVYVAMANGEWHGHHLDPNSQDSLASALASVADAAQETVMELLWLESRGGCGGASVLVVRGRTAASRYGSYPRGRGCTRRFGNVDP